MGAETETNAGAWIAFTRTAVAWEIDAVFGDEEFLARADGPDRTRTFSHLQRASIGVGSAGFAPSAVGGRKFLLKQLTKEGAVWVNFSTATRLALAVATFCLSLLQAEAEDPTPLRCELAREANLIRCEVLADGVAVTDAAVNGGKCRSPSLVYEYNLRMIQQMTGSDAAGMGDFRRSYDKGQSFSLYVDKACAVYEYSVTANGRAWPFRVN